jgi:hypothetical protein
VEEGVGVSVLSKIVPLLDDEEGVTNGETPDAADELGTKVPEALAAAAEGVTVTVTVDMIVRVTTLLSPVVVTVEAAAPVVIPTDGPVVVVADAPGKLADGTGTEEEETAFDATAEEEAPKEATVPDRVGEDEAVAVEAKLLKVNCLLSIIALL